MGAVFNHRAGMWTRPCTQRRFVTPDPFWKKYNGSGGFRAKLFGVRSKNVMFFNFEIYRCVSFAGSQPMWRLSTRRDDRWARLLLKNKFEQCMFPRPSSPSKLSHWHGQPDNTCVTAFVWDMMDQPTFSKDQRVSDKNKRTVSKT